MELLDRLAIETQQGIKRIEAYHGDLVSLAGRDAVDLLIVSAFRDDYTPTSHSLIGALADIGVSVRALAEDKEFDLRGISSCWLSKPIRPTVHGVGFQRILCFEPQPLTPPPRAVGDVFRCLVPAVHRGLATSIAMPLVSTGDAGVPVEQMLDPLLDAAGHWMTQDFPLKCLKIVERDPAKADELRRAFARMKTKYANPPPETASAADRRFDVFVSYSHLDELAATFMVSHLREHRPDVRVFQDRLSLEVGAAWQRRLYAALKECRRFICLYSPNYVKSPVCMEEFECGMGRWRRGKDDLMFPIYWNTADLEPPMEFVLQYSDCREGDYNRLRDACDQFLMSFQTS